MRNTTIHKSLAGLVFFSSLLVYGITAYPSISFWNSGELVACAYSLGISHTSISPLYLLLSNVFCGIPLFAEYAFRMNLFSALFSSLTVLITYLITVHLISVVIKEKVETTRSILIYGGGMVSAFSLAFSDSFWSNAIQAGITNLGLFFCALVVLLSIKWYFTNDSKMNLRYLLLITYLLGLSTGVTWTALFALFPLAVFFYIRYFKLTVVSLVLFIAGSLAVFIIAFPNLIIYFPKFVASIFGSLPARISITSGICILIVVALLLGTIGSFLTGRNWIHLTGVAITLFLIGYSTNVVIPFRASEQLWIHGDDPLSSERYAEYIKDGVYDNNVPVYKRRWSHDPEALKMYNEYNSDFHFFVEYQIQHLFLRYFLWNFVGRTGDQLNAPAYLSSFLDSPFPHQKWVQDGEGYPNVYYGIPLMVGILGFFWQIRHSLVTGAMLFILFIVSGLGFVLFSNISEPIAREYDTFFVTSYFTFAIWIGVGISAAANFFHRMNRANSGVPAFIVAIGILAVPGNMLYANWYEHDHSRDYTARDLAYNLLQSCEEKAILFTQGDNDTFPLFYLQQVLGVRRDIRVVNLGLLNTDWYSEQQIQQNGRDASPVPSSFHESDIKRLSKMDTDAIRRTGWLSDQKEIRIPVPREVMARFLEEKWAGEGGNRKDSSSIKRTSNDLVFLARAKFPVQLDAAVEEIRFFRPWGEVMVEDIVRTTGWRRPIYFSISCNKDAFMGLDEFLRLEGLALRMTPIRIREGSNIFYSALKTNLLSSRTQLSKEPTRAFLFPEKEVGDRYICGLTKHTIMNYRNTFMQLADYEWHSLHDRKSAFQLLERMEEIFPSQLYPMDYRYVYDIAILYRDAGEINKYKNLFRQIIARCWDDIRANPRQAHSIYSPYRYLLEIFRMENEYEKALAVLDTMQKYYPKADDIRKKRKELLLEIQNR